jgi:hypothetical protein
VVRDNFDFDICANLVSRREVFSLNPHAIKLRRATYNSATLCTSLDVAEFRAFASQATHDDAPIKRRFDHCRQCGLNLVNRARKYRHYGYAIECNFAAATRRPAPNGATYVSDKAYYEF